PRSVGGAQADDALFFAPRWLPTLASRGALSLVAPRPGPVVQRVRGGVLAEIRDAPLVEPRDGRAVERAGLTLPRALEMPLGNERLVGPVPRRDLQRVDGAAGAVPGVHPLLDPGLAAVDRPVALDHDAV